MVNIPNDWKNKIRLAPADLEHIINCFKKHFSDKDSLWIFGSRVDTAKKGGDIDLYMETDDKNYAGLVKKKLRFLVEVTDTIGDQQIDFVINAHNVHLPIYEKARMTGIRLV